MAIYLEDELSFYNCMRSKAPNIRNKYLGNGVEILEWENVHYYQSYEGCFPEELRNLTRQMTTEKNDRILFVCDSENMIRKSVLYYALQKHMALYREALANNRPLKGEQTVEIPDSMMAGRVDLCQDKEEMTRVWKNLESLTEWHCVYGQSFEVDGRENLNDDYLWEALFAERDCNVLLGVTNEQYASERTTKLICEGGYRPVFLPVEEEGYYKEFAQNLYVEPAIINSIVLGNGEGMANSDVMWEENEYMAIMGWEDLENVLSILKRRRGKQFCERDIAALFEQTRSAGCSLLEFVHGARRKSYQDLQRMTGFQSIKELTKRRLALFRGRKNNPRLKILGQHYLFVGNPGTGKTEGAQLSHEVLAGSGFLTGEFVVATRQDIVASYTGQTAPKVAKLFDRAAGGTLFVDEAGFFLQKNCGGFIHEAIKEFVRYMDSRRDVTVIFALYPGEKTEFMALDPGLASRIDQVVIFDDHEPDVLCEIGAVMWAEQGYRLTEDAWPVLKEFLKVQKEKNKKTFGNGRAVRRLVELSIQEAEIRKMEQEMDMMPNAMAPDTMVILEDLKKAMQIVLDSEENDNSTVGFSLNNAEKWEQHTPFVAACQAV